MCTCFTTDNYAKDSGYTNILQDKTLFCAFEAGNIVCWLVNPPIAKLDLFKSLDRRWICKTYAEYSYRNLATVRRLVQSPTLQSTIFCGVHSDLRGKGIRVSPAWLRRLPYIVWLTINTHSLIAHALGLLLITIIKYTYIKSTLITHMCLSWEYMLEEVTRHKSTIIILIVKQWM